MYTCPGCLNILMYNSVIMYQRGSMSLDSLVSRLIPSGQGKTHVGYTFELTRCKSSLQIEYWIWHFYVCMNTCMVMLLRYSTITSGEIRDIHGLKIRNADDIHVPYGRLDIRIFSIKFLERFCEIQSHWTLRIPLILIWKIWETAPWIER